MRKFSFFILSCVVSIGAFAQDIPYGKFIDMSAQELRASKFKFDDYKNQWVLQKSNGLQTTANVISALAGTSADIRPHENDYTITVQMGDEGVAYVSVLFYKDQIYHDLMTFASDNGQNMLQTDSGKLVKVQFGYGGYAFCLERNKVNIATTTTNTYAAAKTYDESYNAYVYTIYTEVEPTSRWIRKMQDKQTRRDEKGHKKQSASDLMY